MNKTVKNIVLPIGVLIIFIGFFAFYDANLAEKREQVTHETLVARIQDEQVEQIAVQGDTIEIDLKDGSKLKTTKEVTESFSELMANYGVPPEKVVKAQPSIKGDGASAWIAAILPFAIPLLFFVALIYFMVRQVQGANNRAMNFGMSRAKRVDKKDLKNKVTFKDVAGVKEAKVELGEVMEFLKDPKKFYKLGAKVPKGVLLVGSPGTGKTLLAKAVAGEAGVPFFHVSGSEFNEMFVGVGASRVRDLFAQGKKSAPAIIFVDEIDAVGRKRSGMGGPSEEREQTLNQILVEMDGFDPHDNVIVIAATNRPDVLDPALLRPGRFDRRVYLDPPSIKDREEILTVHAKNKPLAEGVSLKKVAQRTPGFSGADLANLLNEAAILTARNNEETITEQSILDSIEKVMLGPERKSHVLSDKEKKITAYHEGGHALVSRVQKGKGSVQKVSVISRGRAAGYTLNMPEEDKYFTTKSEFIQDLAVMAGGFAAEEIIFGDVTTGAHNDLEKASDLARRMVTAYGMSDQLGPQTLGSEEESYLFGGVSKVRNFSEKTSEVIDQEITKLTQGGYTTAKETITKHREKLEEIVQLLLEKETIEQEEFEALFQGKAD